MNTFENKGINITISTSLEDTKIPEMVKEWEEEARLAIESRKKIKEKKEEISLFDNEEDKPERKPK